MSKRDVRVVPHGKKFAVLVNFVQHGIDYADKALAEKEAEKVRDNKGGFYV